MNIQHQITKRIDATSLRRYFFRLVPSPVKVVNPFKRKRSVQVFLEIGGVVYEFKHHFDVQDKPHIFYIDVPSNEACVRMEYVMLNDKGGMVPPYKSLEVSQKFEDVYEKALQFERKDSLEGNE